MDIDYYLKYAEGLARDIIAEKYMDIDSETRNEINECAFNNPVLIAKLNDYNIDNKHKRIVDPVFMAEVFPHTLLVEDLLETARKQAFDNTLQRIIDSTMIGIPLNFVSTRLIHNMMNLRLRQMALEKKAFEMEKEGNMEKLMKTLKTSSLMEKANVSGVLAQWAEKMKLAIEEVTESDTKKVENRRIIFPKSIPADKLASASVITVVKYLLEACRVSEDRPNRNLTKDGHVKAGGLVVQLAKTFENICSLAQTGHYQKMAQYSFDTVVKKYIDSKLVKKKKSAKKATEVRTKRLGKRVKFTNNQRLKIGAFLMTKVIDTLTFKKKSMVEYKNAKNGKHLEGILIFKDDFFEKLIVIFQAALDDDSRC